MKGRKEAKMQRLMDQLGNGSHMSQASVPPALPTAGTQQCGQGKPSRHWCLSSIPVAGAHGGGEHPQQCSHSAPKQMFSHEAG